MAELVAERVRMGAHEQGPPVPVAPASAGFALAPGSISMVGSRGMSRRMTYRAIYLTNPWVYAAVNKQARDLARMPAQVFTFDADGGRHRQRSDVPSPGPLGPGQRLDRILHYPASGGSEFAMRYGTWVDRLVYGNGIWEQVRDRAGGAPTGIRRLKWRNVVQVVEGTDGAPTTYEYRPQASSWAYQTVEGYTQQSRYLAPSDVVHFGRGTDPESCVGVSPLEACRYTIALYEAIVRQLIAYFENSAQPSAAFTVENLTPEKAAGIREMILDAYASPENAGKVLVTSGKYEALTATPDHNSVIELVRLSREEVATVYGMPPPVIGILEDAIKSNVSELRSQYVREVVGPAASEYEGELMAQMVTPIPSWAWTFVELQLAEALRPDLEARAKVYETLKFVLSIDEIRGFENLEPLKIRGVTDVPWIDSGGMPLPAAAKAAAAPAAPTPPASEPAAQEPAPGEPSSRIPRVNVEGNGHGEHDVDELVELAGGREA